ncbi:MAG: AI-2E family transporter [Alphaproteobacteria bacterium]|nr:AI-2E family transporter [Alphaproteobacteria bacterium]
MPERLKRPRAPRDQARESAQPLPLHPAARLTVRVLIAVALVAAAIWAALDFLPALIWAALLAVALWPLYERTAHAVAHGPSTATALLFTLLIGAVVFLPVALAIYEIAQQSGALGTFITQARDNGVPVPDWVARLPLAAGALEQWWRDNLARPEAASALLQSVNADSVSNLMKTVGGQLLRRLFLLFVALIALFVMLRQGREIAHDLMLTADRIVGDPGERLVERTVAAIRATVSGTVLLATIEGLLIGAGYLLAGVPNPALFAILTAGFAMVPFGAWVVCAAASLTLLVSGASGVAAAALFGWGVLVMLSNDHFVWPRIVGEAARLPFLFAFVGIFGGVASFGLVGLFLGPVIMAALLTVWREWVMKHRPGAEPG